MGGTKTRTRLQCGTRHSPSGGFAGSIPSSSGTLPRVHLKSFLRAFAAAVGLRGGHLPWSRPWRARGSSSLGTQAIQPQANSGRQWMSGSFFGREGGLAQRPSSSVAVPGRSRVGDGMGGRVSRRWDPGMDLSGSARRALAPSRAQTGRPVDVADRLSCLGRAGTSCSSSGTARHAVRHGVSILGLQRMRVPSAPSPPEACQAADAAGRN